MNASRNINMDDIEKTARILLDSRHTVALTGAGISVESGIPPFRGPGSLWEKYDPMEFAHIDSFLRDPEKVWRIFISDMKDVLASAKPNKGHLGLARLEEMGLLKTVITQNIDGLHQAAGNSDVIEFHGTFAWLSCLECKSRIETVKVDLSAMPPRCQCGGIYRPECVFFGEMIPPEALSRSQQEARACDVMLVIGTSAVVQPAALMPIIARESGARVIEINPEPTPLTGSTSEILLQGPAGEVMDLLLDAIEKLR